MNAIQERTSHEEDTINFIDSLSAVDSKSLKLLGSGLSATIVASAVGVTESYISQLVSNPQFAFEVARLRSESTQAYIDLDNKYDSVEKKLVDRLEGLLPLMMRPMEVLRAIQVINAAKRKTVPAMSLENQVVNNQVVQLTLPSVIVQKFTVNINNQVVTAGAQNLVTANSIQLQQLASEDKSNSRAISNTSNMTEVQKTEVIKERVNTLLNTQKQKELQHECIEERTD